MLESELRQRPDRLDQILEAAIRRKVAHNGDASLRTVPERVEDPNVLLRDAVSLPITDPAFEHLSYLSVADGHLLDAVYFQTRPMQHLLNRSRSRFKY